MMENNDNFNEVSPDEVDEAIQDAIYKLIEGIGSAEKEDIQEGSSKYSQENRQEQLKKDIIWLKNFQKNNNTGTQIGLAGNRIKRKEILDIDI